LASFNDSPVLGGLQLSDQLHAGLPQLLPQEDAASTGSFMATRMLCAMVGAQQLVSYQTFLQQMDDRLQRSLSARHLMDFIEKMTGVLPKNLSSFCRKID
jgi:hypothetical protein